MITKKITEQKTAYSVKQSAFVLITQEETSGDVTQESLRRAPLSSLAKALRDAGITIPSPDYDDRLTDLENKLSDLMYEPITVTSFTNSVGTVEMGAVVQSVTLTWKFSKTPVSVTLDGETMAADSTGTALTGLSITAGKTWTLSATDERGAVATKTTSISFINGVYTGAGGGDTAILSLSRSLQSGRARTFTATAGAGEYLWYACPTRYGAPTFTVGGFEGGFSKVRTESFTNSSGYTESYDVWRSDNAGLGATTVVVK